jgi:hypothetical protein
MNATVTIKISGNTKDVPVLILENIDFRDPIRIRQLIFKDGEWLGKFSNFPIDTDNKLDFALVAAGIPNQECKVNVTVQVGNKSKSKETVDNFGNKGWSIIKDQLNLLE